MKRIFALFVLFCLCLFAKAYNTTLCYSAPSQKWMGALSVPSPTQGRALLQ